MQKAINLSLFFGRFGICLYLCGRMKFARENRLRLSNSSKLDCIRLALSLHFIG